MNFKEEKTYETNDLYLSVFLLSKKQELIDTDKQGEKTIFIFNKTPELINLEKQYYFADLKEQPKVELFTFIDALKKLKYLLYR